MKKIYNIIFLIVLLSTLLFAFSFNKINNPKLIAINDSNVSNQDLDYTETLDSFDNPERGFYTYLYYEFKESGNEDPKPYLLEGNLIHLRLRIGAFSGKVNGNKDIELSEDMLNMFDKMLKKIKENGATAIVRFSYDNKVGSPNQEPSLDMILKHIEQISSVITENKDVISYVELGFFGPWGEMHTSDISTPENVTKALNVMLDNTPEEIKIGVRQPKYYVDFANIDRAKLNENITVKGTKEYRVGLFNDGYLGSHSDLGTFADREIEISWLENQALHTLYGGEVVGTRGDADNDKINTANYMAKEAFRTHTTYLNFDYDEDVINSWKDEIYNGDDNLYKGKSGYLYINNHLGYRFVLRNSFINQLNNNLNIDLNIENVGFANLVNNKKVSIILENDLNKFEFITEIDPTIWNSQDITKLNISIPIPENFSETDYNVYLRISKYGDYLTDNNYQCIRLANNNVWNETLGANYIGKFTYQKEELPKEPDDIQDIPDIPVKEPIIDNNEEQNENIQNNTNNENLNNNQNIIQEDNSNMNNTASSNNLSNNQDNYNSTNNQEEILPNENNSNENEEIINDNEENEQQKDIVEIKDKNQDNKILNYLLLIIIILFILMVILIIKNEYKNYKNKEN